MLMFQPLIRYAQFSGRARRAEYWLYALLMTVVAGPLCAVILAADATGRDDVAWVLFIPYVLFVLGTFVPSLAVTFRRLHDIDKPAAWILIVLVPILGPIVLLIFTLIEGAPGPNRFGPDPKNRQPAPSAAPAAASD